MSSVLKSKRRPSKFEVLQVAYDFRIKLDEGKVTYEMIEQTYRSWVGGYKKYLSKKQLENLDELFINLFKETK